MEANPVSAAGGRAATRRDLTERIAEAIEHVNDPVILCSLLAEAEEMLDAVAQLISLYEMSYSDPMGVSTADTVACIANVLEYGHPAGQQET